MDKVWGIFETERELVGINTLGADGYVYVSFWGEKMTRGEMIDYLDLQEEIAVKDCGDLCAYITKLHGKLYEICNYKNTKRLCYNLGLFSSKKDAESFLRENSDIYESGYVGTVELDKHIIKEE
jgi:hypothetical protein